MSIYHYIRAVLPDHPVCVCVGGWWWGGWVDGWWGWVGGWCGGWVDGWGEMGRVGDRKLISHVEVGWGGSVGWGVWVGGWEGEWGGGSKRGNGVTGSRFHWFTG